MTAKTPTWPHGQTMVDIPERFCCATLQLWCSFLLLLVKPLFLEAMPGAPSSFLTVDLPSQLLSIQAAAFVFCRQLGAIRLPSTIRLYNSTVCVF